MLLDVFERNSFISFQWNFNPYKLFFFTVGLPMIVLKKYMTYLFLVAGVGVLKGEQVAYLK